MAGSRNPFLALDPTEDDKPQQPKPQQKQQQQTKPAPAPRANNNASAPVESKPASARGGRGRGNGRGRGQRGGARGGREFDRRRADGLGPPSHSKDQDFGGTAHQPERQLDNELGGEEDAQGARTPAENDNTENQEPTTEEPPVKTFEQYLEERNSAKPTLNARTTARQANEGSDQWANSDAAPLVKSEEVLFEAKKADKAARAKREANKEVLAMDFQFAAVESGRGSRGGRPNNRGRGRGGDRGRRGGGRGGRNNNASAPAHNINLTDSNAFPELG